MNEELIGQILGALVNKNDNNNGFGGDGALWIIIFLVLLGGGWNNRGYGNNQGGGSYGVGGNELYPWLSQQQNVNEGFRDQMINSGLTGLQQSVTNGFAGVQQSLCSGFAGVNQGMANGFSQTQLSMLQGFNGLQAQQAQCCCDNQLAMANQTAALLAEHCSDRQALNDGVRDIIASNTANTQSVIDKLCQLELDGYKRQVADEQRTNADLRSQLTQARFDASQQAQNAYIQQGFANEVDALYNRLNSCPVPSMPVYGRTPIFKCESNGCPCNN